MTMVMGRLGKSWALADMAKLQAQAASKPRQVGGKVLFMVLSPFDMNQANN
jgi:hypothetical protein